MQSRHASFVLCLALTAVAAFVALPAAGALICPGTYPPCSTACSCDSRCLRLCCATIAEPDACVNYVCRNSPQCGSSQVAALGEAVQVSSSCNAEPAAEAFFATLDQTIDTAASSAE